MVCHDHNLAAANLVQDGRFGIPSTMPLADTFRSILGERWVGYRRYGMEEERGAALAEIVGKHANFCAGDVPNIVGE